MAQATLTLARLDCAGSLGLFWESNGVWRRCLKAVIADGSAELRPCERFFWRSLPLNQLTGSDIFARLFQANTTEAGLDSIATLLESPYPLPPDSLPAVAVGMARYSICAGAPRSVDNQAQLWTPAIGEVFPLLEQMGKVAPPQCLEGTSDLPFVGGWLGWLGYDCAWEVEQLPWLKEDALPFPTAFWYEPAEFAVLDHHHQQLWLAAESSESISSAS